MKLREQPGWVTFSLDGKYAYPSTGEVIDTATKKIVATLADEKGREVHSEKMVEIHFKDGVPVAAGDQFGVGRGSSAGRATSRRLQYLIAGKCRSTQPPRPRRRSYRPSCSRSARSGKDIGGTTSSRSLRFLRLRIERIVQHGGE